VPIQPLRFLAFLAMIFFAGSAVAEPIRIVALGDSLTAGYGVAGPDAFPVRLEAALRARGHDVAIVNAGVSGDTATDGLARVDWSLGEDADAVIVELGANDALRGVDPKITRDALDRLLAKIGEKRTPVLVAGMMAPRNLGKDYVQAFDAIYPDLAKKHGAILYPFFLDGIALDQRFNLNDGLHPNSKGVAEITRNILPTVERLLERVRTRQAAVTKG
jgi:acyl-CoA thioesterase-1